MVLKKGIKIIQGKQVKGFAMSVSVFTGKEKVSDRCPQFLYSVQKKNKKS